MNDETLKYMNSNGISSSTDGYLRDLVIRGQNKAAIAACDGAIERWERHISAVRVLQEMLGGKKA